MTSDDVTVRVREEADLGASARALVKVHAVDGYPVEGVDDPRAWLTPPGLLRAWVAELDREVVGHVGVGRADGGDAVLRGAEALGGSGERIAVLARLFVLPEARRRAVGERLTVAATEFARASGLRLVLDVMAKDRAAIRLYERLGWECTGQVRHAVEGAEAVPAYCYLAPPEG
ncbi:GNAT family N-acetyltransferase [Nocardiopsis tropica]|nr:GNAT family N-acetyltransferase [Nocardiopsis tropica]